MGRVWISHVGWKGFVSHSPLENDISVQNKFNLKSNWFLIYEGKPPPNWTFVHGKYQWSPHWKTAWFMPRAASTCLWEGFWYSAIIFCLQQICTVEVKGKEMLGSLTNPGRAAIWGKQAFRRNRRIEGKQKQAWTHKQTPLNLDAGWCRIKNGHPHYCAQNQRK